MIISLEDIEAYILYDLKIIIFNINLSIFYNFPNLLCWSILYLIINTRFNII